MITMKPEFIPSVLITLLSVMVCVVLFLILQAGLQKAELPLEQSRRIRRNAVMVFAGWILCNGLLAATGFYAINGLPPRPVVAALIGAAGLVYFSTTSTGRLVLRATPLHTLIYLQAFRVAVEILLWLACRKGLLPQQMTFEGRNWDILTGMLAIPAGFIIQQSTSLKKPVAIAFNIVGLALLVNVLAVAVLSMPTPIRYFNEGPSLAIVAGFPFIYLPTVLVVAALAAHIISLRQLLSIKKTSTLRGAANPGPLTTG
jgi:predicted anti-sigma-YlaC factor YlaD